MEFPATKVPSAARDLIADAAANVFGGLLDSATRRYRLDAVGALAGLQVEAFVVEKALSQPWRMALVVLHERADLDLDAVPGYARTPLEAVRRPVV